jgi:hypothetical protein
VLCFRHDDNDRGVRQANTARALARWQHLVALHEATDTLYRAMSVGMVIAIDVESVTFYFFINNRVANNLINTPSINRFR